MRAPFLISVPGSLDFSAAKTGICPSFRWETELPLCEEPYVLCNMRKGRELGLNTDSKVTGVCVCHIVGEPCSHWVIGQKLIKVATICVLWKIRLFQNLNQERSWRLWPACGHTCSNLHWRKLHMVWWSYTWIRILTILTLSRSSSLGICLCHSSH